MDAFVPVFVTFSFQFDAVQDMRCPNKKDCEYREGRLCEGHTLLIGVKQFPSVLFTFIVRYECSHNALSWNNGAAKAVLFLWA